MKDYNLMRLVAAFALQEWANELLKNLDASKSAGATFHPEYERGLIEAAALAVESGERLQALANDE